MTTARGMQSVPVRVRTPNQPSAEQSAQDWLAEEVPVALVYNGISHAVMMATPANLEEFALGFSLTEQIISRPEQIYGIDVVPACQGVEIQIELASECFQALKLRRRNLTGRTGCGLCGTESLEQAVTLPNPLVGQALPTAEAIEHALQQMRNYQPLQQQTGAVHATAICNQDGQILLAREDVGRHNALDKLIGAWCTAQPQETPGFVLVSSRASYEMVNKCAQAGLPSLVAISAPTTLAIQYATAANMNLIGFARPGRHVIYAISEQSPGEADASN